MHQTELGPRAGEVGGQGGLHCLLAAEGVDQDPASVKVRGPEEPGSSHLGISAPLLETGEARLVLRGRGTGGGGQGNESDLPIPNFSPVLSRRLSLDLFPRLTRSSILFSL